MALFSRRLFGTSGAALATLIFFATAIYYAVFEGAVMSVAAHHLYPAVPYWLVALVVVIYSVLLIFGSVQRWLDKFNGVLLPFYLLGLLLAVVMATQEYGYSDAWLSFGPPEGPSRALVGRLRVLHGRVGPDDVHLRLRPLRQARGPDLP